MVRWFCSEAAEIVVIRRAAVEVVHQVPLRALPNKYSRIGLHAFADARSTNISRVGSSTALWKRGAHALQTLHVGRCPSVRWPPLRSHPSLHATQLEVLDGSVVQGVV